MEKQQNLDMPHTSGVISVRTICEKLIWVLTVFLIFTFLLFGQDTWGRYSFIVTAVLILILSIISDGGRLVLSFGAYQGLQLILIVFAFTSSLWAISSKDALQKSATLAQILVCYSLIYLHYIKKDNVNDLLRAVMWAGYGVAIYSIFFYGLDEIMKATEVEDVRLESMYNNVNAIGLLCAFACVIQFAFFLYEKRRLWTMLFAIPAVMVVAATQSRKAFLVIILGIFGLIIFKNLGNRKSLTKIFKTLFWLVVAIVALRFLLRLEIFNGVTERMQGMINTFTGAGPSEASATTRQKMIEVGLESWKQHPICGVGIGNAHIICEQYLHKNTYLHNNFVELLCSGGLIGFALYYVSYVYLFVNLVKYRKADQRFFAVCFVWLVLLLIMDYGTVSYYEKVNCFYMMIQFINIECLKKKARNMRNELQKANKSRIQVSD